MEDTFQWPVPDKKHIIRAQVQNMATPPMTTDTCTVEEIDVSQGSCEVVCPCVKCKQKRLDGMTFDVSDDDAPIADKPKMKRRRHVPVSRRICRIFLTVIPWVMARSLVPRGLAHYAIGCCHARQTLYK